MEGNYLTYDLGELKEKDYQSLEEQERKVYIQRFIDLIIYNPQRFKTAIRMMERWEKQDQNRLAKKNKNKE